MERAWKEDLGYGDQKRYNTKMDQVGTETELHMMEGLTRTCRLAKQALVREYRKNNVLGRGF